VQFGFETEPTWATIRSDVFGEIRLQSLIGSTVTSISVLVGSMFVVIVYTGFALAERRRSSHASSAACRRIRPTAR
jgi:AI-2 transport protein TqsA